MQKRSWRLGDLINENLPFFSSKNQIKEFSTMKTSIVFFLLIVCGLLAVPGCTAENVEGQMISETAQHEFTLHTGVLDGRMAFIGAGGAIDGLVNPELRAVAGETVRIILVNSDGMMHDLAIPGLHVQTSAVLKKNSRVEMAFTPATAGTYSYYCTISGHRQAGMEGAFIVAQPES
jgi:nitrite reductase (NO-forming)